MNDHFSVLATGQMIKTYVLGIFTMLFGALTVNEVAAIFGMVGMIVTTLLNWYYRHKSYKLELAKYELERQEHDRK